MAGISSGRRWAFWLIAVAVAVIALASRSNAQSFFPGVPLPPAGTPAGWVPLSNTSGFAPWGPIALDAGSLSPGSAGQVLTTNGTPSAIWSRPTYVSVVTGYGADPTGVSDSTTSIQNALNALAATGACVWFPAGTYLVSAPLITPSFTCIQGGPDVIINASMSHTGGPTENLFYVEPSSQTSLTTLTAPNVAGGTTFTVASIAGISNGQGISLTNGNLGAYYTVTGAPSGSTVTVDRPIAPIFPTSSTVYAQTPPQDVIIWGNDMILQTAGSGADRAVEMVGCLRCLVADVRVQKGTGGGFDDIAVSLDIGSRDSAIQRVRVDGGGTDTACLALEGAEGCAISDSRAQHCTVSNGYGIFLADSYYSEIANDFSTANTVGLAVTSNDAQGQGSQACRIVGGSTFANSSHGTVIQLGSSFNVFSSHTSNYNGGSGYYLQNAGDANHVTRTSIGDCVAKGNAGDGVTVIAGVVETSIDDPTSGSNGGFSINAGGDVFVSNLVSDNDANGIQSSGSANFQLTGAYFNSISTSSSWTAITGATTGLGQVSNTRINGNGGGGARNVLDCPSAGEWHFEDVKATGTITNGIYMGHGVASVFRRAPNVDMSVASTPYTFDSFATLTTVDSSGITVNPATAAGATPVGMTFAPQGPNASCNASGPCTPSGITVQFASAGATGTPGAPYETFKQGATSLVAIGPYANGSSLGTITLGPSAASPSTANYSAAADSATLYLNAPSTSVNFAIAGGQYAEITTSAFQPLSFGGLTAGTSTAPFGATFFGAGIASGGYTEYAGATGTHNTQDGLSVCWTDEERISSYSAKNFNVYPLGGGSFTTAHGLSYTCTITGRVVTAGTGTGCTFWATGAHGTPDTSFACTVRATGQLHSGAWSAYAAPFYPVCDVTASSTPGSGSPSNPVFTFSATTTTTPNQVTVQWSPFNDTCGTSAPVIDAQSRCCLEDN